MGYGRSGYRRGTSQANIPAGFYCDERTGVIVPCLHFGAVPVESLAGEVVAKLCPACDRQLPAGFTPLPHVST